MVLFYRWIRQKTCNKIRNSAKGKWEESVVNIKKGITDEERITGSKQIPGINKKVRISDHVWTTDQWIYDTIWSWMEEANERAGWKYDIRFAESMQITRYKKGGYYAFHKDGKSDNLSTHDDGTIRKLSMSIILNNNYDGGQFQFATLTPEAEGKIHTTYLSTGSVIVFPSFLTHRVKPVTRGVRYSLVAWFVGVPFK